MKSIRDTIKTISEQKSSSKSTEDLFQVVSQNDDDDTEKSNKSKPNKREAKKSLKLDLKSTFDQTLQDVPHTDRPKKGLVTDSDSRGDHPPAKTARGERKKRIGHLSESPDKPISQKKKNRRSSNVKEASRTRVSDRKHRSMITDSILAQSTASSEIETPVSLLVSDDNQDHKPSKKNEEDAVQQQIDQLEKLLEAEETDHYKPSKRKTITIDQYGQPLFFNKAEEN